uniref:26S proteasome complex subunit SEM1 n=1 Tax=Pristiophorus japonicus TaxID=55135 RepID=UPI00398F8D3F
MAERKAPVDLGLLEEDDEFEEFPAEGQNYKLYPLTDHGVLSVLLNLSVVVDILQHEQREVVVEEAYKRPVELESGSSSSGSLWSRRPIKGPSRRSRSSSSGSSWQRRPAGAAVAGRQKSSRKKSKGDWLVIGWTGLDEDEDAHVWEDNWDDDNVEDDFSNQLRAELEKFGYKMETS